MIRRSRDPKLAAARAYLRRISERRLYKQQATVDIDGQCDLYNASEVRPL